MYSHGSMSILYWVEKSKLQDNMCSYESIKKTCNLFIHVFICVENLSGKRMGFLILYNFAMFKFSIMSTCNFVALKKQWRENSRRAFSETVNGHVTHGQGKTSITFSNNCFSQLVLKRECLKMQWLVLSIIQLAWESSENKNSAERKLLFPNTHQPVALFPKTKALDHPFWHYLLSRLPAL